MQKTSKYPSQGELIIPLLDVLNDLGGRSKPSEVYEQVGLRFGLSDEEINRKDPSGSFKIFQRSVRWVKEKLKMQGLVNSPEFSVWELTERGKMHLINCRPGVMVHIFFTHLGDAFWGEFKTISSMIEDNAVMLHLTSPPYPLLKEKAYGNVSATKYIDWVLPFCEEAYRTLSEDGSFILNLGEVYNPGEPTVNTYMERLVIALEDKIGFKLCGRFYLMNRSKLPTPINHVAITRKRVKNVIEPIYWFGKTADPKADNSKVLVEYSEAQKKIIKKGHWEKQHRPSGHYLSGDFAKDNGGAIPGNVLDIPNTSSNDPYQRLCRERGLKPHPARFPLDMARFFIKFLSEKGDLIADLFGGSGTVAQACEELGRRWILGEKSLYYLMTASMRFPQATKNKKLLDFALNNAV